MACGVSGIMPEMRGALTPWAICNSAKARSTTRTGGTPPLSSLWSSLWFLWKLRSARLDEPYPEHAPKQLCIKMVLRIFSGGQGPSGGGEYGVPAAVARRRCPAPEPCPRLGAAARRLARAPERCSAAVGRRRWCARPGEGKTCAKPPAAGHRCATRCAASRNAQPHGLDGITPGSWLWEQPVSSPETF